jgi:serine protease Do
VLAVACATLVLGMAVLAAWAISERANLPTDTSTPSVSQESGTTPSQEESQGNEENSAENSQYNPDAPELIISDSDAEDGGLTTAQIVQNNLDSTVVLDIYDYKTTNSFFGSTNSTLTPIGSATGTIMTEDGYIITNAHCVSDETTGKAYARVDVTLYNGQTYTAEVIAFDHTTDLGVIKIDATGLQRAEFGDSSKLSLGDRVVVLGNGASLGWSCTQGIVSGTGRPFYEDAGYAIPCIQTDAIINPGNSGGPFLNNMGQVVGITSAKIVAEGYEGLYFVIPINEAKVIIDDLLKYGYVRGRVAIGITGGDTNTEGYEGFMIETIAEDSTLSGSGAKRGDIITAIDGETVKGYADLRTVMAKHKAGDTVTITPRRLEFDRSGRYITNDTTFEVSCVLQESRG